MLEKFRAKFEDRVGLAYVLHPRQLKVGPTRLYALLYMGFCL